MRPSIHPGFSEIMNTPVVHFLFRTCVPAYRIGAMTRACIRVYAELNDFLPEELRRRAFTRQLPAGADVLRLLSDLHIPPATVDLVIAADEPVDLSHVIQEGERISLFPVFEALDIAPATRIRDEPLRDPRFIVSGEMKLLGDHLSALGFDVQIAEGLPGDPDAVTQAEEEGRILLSLSGREAGQAEMSRVLILVEQDPRMQLREVITRLDLGRIVSRRGRNGTTRKMEEIHSLLRWAGLTSEASPQNDP